jgi:hypothetical protein
MCDDKFSFPIKVGEFVKLKILPEILNYGIYRVKIARSGDNSKFFRFNEFDYYTHYHIKAAKALGLSMELIIDEQSNALLYKKGRANGHTYFSQLVMELYKNKGECVLVKQLLSCLWGVLCSKYIQKKDTIKKPLNLTNQKIVSIKPISGDDVSVGYLLEKQFYRYDYARIGVFLTSRNCEKMVQELLPYAENIKRFHTDGFISDTKISTLKIGKDIGDWKFEKEGKCEIINCTTIKWSK